MQAGWVSEPWTCLYDNIYNSGGHECQILILTYVYLQDLEGQTALHYATVCEREAIAKYLFERGADANIADNDGATPLKLCPPHWVWLRGTST